MDRGFSRFIVNLWCLLKQIAFTFLLRVEPFSFKRKTTQSTSTYGSKPHRPPKPEWVKKEVLRLKALMPHEGCRKIAYTFNRLHGKNRDMTVGKSYVYSVISKHQYEIRVLRRNLKHKKPRPLPKNFIWSVDLTQVTGANKSNHLIFGIIDSGTRANICLESIANKASITLLRFLLDSIERYGKPKVIRTDNESVFVSRLFKLGLWTLGIKHQRTEICCPWMNGKIERFFRTFKEKLAYAPISSSHSLPHALATFRFWYNHVRPHQHLDGKTPVEAWSVKELNRFKKSRYFSAWNGSLAGFYCSPS